MQQKTIKQETVLTADRDTSRTTVAYFLNGVHIDCNNCIPKYLHCELRPNLFSLRRGYYWQTEYMNILMPYRRPHVDTGSFSPIIED